MLNPVHLPLFAGYVECCSSCRVSPRSQRLWLWRRKCSFQLGVSCSTWWLFHFFLCTHNESFWNFIAQLLHLSCLLLVHLSSLLYLCSRHSSVKVIVKDNPLKGVAACNIRSGVEKHWCRTGLGSHVKCASVDLSKGVSNCLHTSILCVHYSYWWYFFIQYIIETAQMHCTGGGNHVIENTHNIMQCNDTTTNAFCVKLLIFPKMLFNSLVVCSLCYCVRCNVFMWVAGELSTTDDH